jgi:hypothetical protein
MSDTLKVGDVVTYAGSKTRYTITEITDDRRYAHLSFWESSKFGGIALLSNLRFVDPAHDHTKHLHTGGTMKTPPHVKPNHYMHDNLGDPATCLGDHNHPDQDDLALAEHDPVNHPSHYTSDPSGVECITITRHRSFNVGNAIKYLWRAGLKGGGDKAKHIEDLQKVLWYVQDEINILEGKYNAPTTR